MMVLVLRSSGDGFAGEGKSLYFRGSVFLQFSICDQHERVPNKLLIASHSANQSPSPPC